MATTKVYKVTSLRTYNGSQEALDQLQETRLENAELKDTIKEMMDGTVTSVPTQNVSLDLKVSAFENCTSLERFDSYINSLGEKCFKNCTSLQAVSNISSAYIDVPNQAFMNCHNLETVLSSDFTNVGESAFAGCYKLKTNIRVYGLVGMYAFQYCQALKNIYINKLNGSYAFEGCTSLETVTLSPNMGEIYYGTFKGCTKLTSVVGMENAGQISGEAFMNCSSLTSIVVTHKTYPMPASTFQGCTSLTNIQFAGTVAQAANVFHNLSADVPATTIQCSDGNYTITH